MSSVAEICGNISYCMYCYSDFLFAISHPDKEGYPQRDSSDDPDILLDTNIIQSFTPRQLALERVIAKKIAKYHINGIITNRMRTLLSSKMWRMGNEILCLGDTSKERLLGNLFSRRLDLGG